MVNKLVNKKILLQKNRDYSFAFMFLVVFSIFIFFAIRPSLTTAFSLKKEEEDLKKTDSIYEKKITEILTVQSLIEENRDRLYLLEQAISNTPQVNKVIKDISDLAEANSYTIKKANIGEVSLINSENKNSQKLRLFIEGKGDFENLLKFIQDLSNQRRIKTIENLTIAKDIESSNSAQLMISLELDGYYL